MVPVTGHFTVHLQGIFSAFHVRGHGRRRRVTVTVIVTVTVAVTLNDAAGPDRALRF